MSRERATLLPEKIDKYQVLNEIGHGAMGTVYLGRDPKLERYVAIKVLSAEYVDNEQQDRFLREAKAAGRLGHPNIVTVYDFGSFRKNREQRSYIAFEYVEGPSLADLIHDKEKFPRHSSLHRKLQMMEELCDGLAFAHRAKIVHRDIKPANIIVQELSGSIKILDFGIARWLDASATQTTSV